MNLRFRRSGLDFSRRRRKVNKTLAKEVGTWIGEIAIAVLFALVLVYFVGYRADVVGPSMLGTLAEGDEVLVNRFVYKLTQPKTELAEDEIEVGEDEFFVLGDNRNNSEDSRYANIGNVKKEYIVGKAWFIVSPLKDFGFVK